MHRSKRLTIALALVAAIILVAGGAAIASNAGFKMNKEFELVPSGGGGFVGNNWVSIPYFNPYGTVPCDVPASCTVNGQLYPSAQGLCDAFGLTAPDSIGVQVCDFSGNPNGICGFRGPDACGSAGIRAIPLVPGLSYEIRSTTDGSATTNAIIVGSHDPTLQLTIPFSGVGINNNLRMGVPYHSTAATRQDVCDQLGLTVTPGNEVSTLNTFNASTGQFRNACFCNGLLGCPDPLILGEGLELRHIAVTPFVPAHF